MIHSRFARRTVQSALLVLVLVVAALPVLGLGVRVVSHPSADFTSFLPSLQFAVGGAALGTLFGGFIGAIAGTLRIPGRRTLLMSGVGLLAAPPAFWWLGLTRVGYVGGFNNRFVAVAIAGIAYAPVTLLLVTAAIREIPSSSYEAARVALNPFRRVAFVLFPLLRPAVLAGFFLTMILLLGESEIPFLFGFRTSMTDIVTAFARTFVVSDVMAPLVPVLVLVIAVGIVLTRPMFAVLLPRATAGQGIIRWRTTRLSVLPLLVLPAVVVLALTGFASATLSGDKDSLARVSANASGLSVSVLEPVGCAVVSAIVAVLVSYPLRRSSMIRPLAGIGLVLFCIPAAVTSIGWIAVGQAVGGLTIPPAVAHMSRTVGLSVLAFVVGYSRLPRSQDDAARLLPMTAIGRLWRVTLPLLAPSIAAASALTAALIFADRDVASILLAPGSSRLMLNLYLLSANGRAAAIGATALLVAIVGSLVIALAGAAPLLSRFNVRE